MFDVVVEIRGLEGLADPEGLAVERALPALGFEGVHGLHVGKVVRFCVDADDADEAETRAEALCRRLLVNPVTERAEIRVATTDARDRP